MYSNDQYCEMVLLYGQCSRNKRVAAKQYALNFPGQKHPSGNTIVSAVKRLKETGSFKKRFPTNRFTDSTLLIPDEDILGYALAYPQCSVRDISKACGCSKSCIWRVLNKYGAHPYRPILGQELLSGDKQRRFDFCNFILNKHDQDPFFVNDIMWTDECQFTRQGVVNAHNVHYWSLENPHNVRPNKHQVRWSVNVWCGLWKSTLIGPFIFEDTLTSEKYTEILSGPLSDFLEESVSIRDLQRMWFQHDGAPAHKSRKPCTFLNVTFQNNIIGYGGPVEWPPRSPDLTPLDYFLWGFLKDKVYERESTSKTDLINRIFIGCKSVTAAMLRKVQGNFISRVQSCISAEGSHFEQILR